MKKDVYTHSLKLNSDPASHSYSPWMLHSDNSKFSILKDDKLNHWSKRNDHLKNIKLEGDSLIQLGFFWNMIDIAVNTTLATSKRTRLYKQPNQSYSIKDVITSPLGHSICQDVITIYEKLARIMYAIITK